MANLANAGASGSAEELEQDEPALEVGDLHRLGVELATGAEVRGVSSDGHAVASTGRRAKRQYEGDYEGSCPQEASGLSHDGLL